MSFMVPDQLFSYGKCGTEDGYYVWDEEGGCLDDWIVDGRMCSGRGGRRREQGQIVEDGKVKEKGRFGGGGREL